MGKVFETCNKDGKGSFTYFHKMCIAAGEYFEHL